MKFEYLEHTADVKFRAYGKTVEEAFTNAALALTPLLTDDTVKPISKHKICVESHNKEALLYDFLDEILFQLDVEGFLLAKVDDLMIEESKKGFKLTATAWFDRHKNYECHGNLKSVTYNDMFIKEEQNNCVVQVVIDV